MNDQTRLSQFEAELAARIRNGPEDAEPFAKAWLAVVRVPCLRGVDGYVSATCEIPDPLETAVLPVVPNGLPFTLQACGVSAVWAAGRVSAHWFGRGRQHAVVAPDGRERTILLEFSGAAFAAFQEKDAAASWARRRSDDLLAAHRASVAAYRLRVADHGEH